MIFYENCNFRRSSSRVCESSIFKKKKIKLQKTSDFWWGQFLRDVLANIAFLAKNDEKKQRYLVHILDPKMVKMWSILIHFFNIAPGDYLGACGGHFLRDVSREIDIFKVPTLQDFDKFWSKKGAKMGPKLSIDFVLIFDWNLKRFLSEYRGMDRSRINNNFIISIDRRAGIFFQNGRNLQICKPESPTRFAPPTGGGGSIYLSIEDASRRHTAAPPPLDSPRWGILSLGGWLAGLWPAGWIAVLATWRIPFK